MLRRSSRQLRLLIGTAAAALAAGGTAFAQDASDKTGEIVVTANRQGAEVISRVPMSITAESQKTLDQLSVKTAQDLSRIVPALKITGNGPTGVNISIRGIASSNGAATTGVYLDDTALQTRNLVGIATGGGVFVPQLFDLDRVEVLKGPQGTLYGGSSEGGTVRFITPDPSLTHYTGYAKAEANTIHDGGQGGELGAAFGGPLVQDKVGFRISAWGRHIAGWVDHVDWRNTSNVLAKDTNSEDQQAYRLAVKIRATDNLSLTPAVYYGWDRKSDADTVYNSIPSFTTPAFGTLVSTGKALPGGGLLPAGYAAPTTSGVVTNVPGYVGQQVYVHAGHTYQAVNLGRYQTILNAGVGDSYAGSVTPEKSPRKSSLFVPSLSIDYDAGRVLIKSVTSYIHDQTDGDLNLSAQEIPNATATAGYSPSVQSPYIFDLTTPFIGHYFYHARRNAISEELRLTSAPSESRLSWIAGVYFNNAKTFSSNFAPENRSAYSQALFGHPQATPLCTATVTTRCVSQAEIDAQNQVSTNQWLTENQMAGFGEANFRVTDKLKLTAGVRISREEITYLQRQWGLIYLASETSPITTQGSTVETPVTPKFGVSYQATAQDLIYFTAAKGYRAGGVQSQASPVQCAADLAALGISSTPSTYGSDSVWSYEAGAKVGGFDGRARLAASAFYINWNNPQTPYTLPTCVFSYITNIGKAVSKGFDLQGTLLPVQGLSINFGMAYTDAHYSQDVTAVNGALLVANGQQFIGIPKWTANVGARYDFPLSGRLNGYVQGSWQYTASYRNSAGPGISSYAPDVFETPAMNYVTARLGVTWAGYDLSIFADNLFNEDALMPTTLGGRNACRNASCSVYGSYYQDIKGVTFRPRTIGVTGTYHY